MSWINLYFYVLKQYATFNGRAQRQEYWKFAFVSLIVSLALTLVGSLAGVKDLLANVYSFAVLIPYIAVGVRRLHDTNRSGCGS
ncbi:MAG: DUF805 domain-containing protein [Candidatus Methylumidiphilus sp.]